MNTVLPKAHERNLLPRGFSLVELLVVVAIMLVVAAFTVPVMISAVRAGKLRGAASDYANVLQTARMRAVQDDRYYSVYTQPANGNVPQLAYVDIYPQAINGASGTGAPPVGSYQAGPPADPMVVLSSDVVPQARGAAPNPVDLETKFCASCGAFVGGGPIKNTAPTFGPEGVPCTPIVSVGGTGTVCNSSGGISAYETFFQSTPTQAWVAVTLTPAGRIKTWYYNAGSGTWAPQD